MTTVDVKTRWDARAGLFLLPPGARGHTADCFGRETLHSLPDSVSFMTYAAITGRLNEIDSLGILKTITQCQFRDADRRGLIKWYLEDREQTDGNAPFFICTGLIPLRKYFSKALGSECCLLMDGILAEALHFFMDRCKHGSCYYPNSFLGDIVFAWLINEMCGDEQNDAFLLNILNGSVKYWTEEGWGWGEHMSDVYALVCNYQISMLILMSERLPDETRKSYVEALRQLLDIEDHFSGKPRVPTIRSYAFAETPKAYPFRLAIKEWSPAEPVVISNLPPVGPILKRLGWHDMAPPRARPLKEMEVPCANGAIASAFIESDFRIGGMSRYPVMDNCDQQGWGLSWQSFPVAFLHDAGDWGFLQWVAEEEGSVYAHPRHMAKWGQIKGLTTTVNPPITGNTFAVRKGGNLLVLRRMPAIARAWTKLSDRLRVVSPSAAIKEEKLSDNVSTLSFTWPGRSLSVARVTLSDAPAQVMAHQKGGLLDWDIEYGASSLSTISDAVVLWAFCTDGQITELPVIKREVLKRRPSSNENCAFALEWTMGTVEWRYHIDPLSAAAVRSPLPISAGTAADPLPEAR